MAQGGGRGWFRRRTQSDQPTADGTDSLQPSDADLDNRALEVEATSAEDEFARLLEGGGERFSSGPRATTDVAAAATASGEANAADGIPAPARATSIDWDAATAAALADDGSASDAPARTAPSSGASAPDLMLEEIIREIVGDAAADTVSSLHQPSPMQQPVSDGTQTADRPRDAPSGDRDIEVARQIAPQADGSVSADWSATAPAYAQTEASPAEGATGETKHGSTAMGDPAPPGADGLDSIPSASAGAQPGAPRVIEASAQPVVMDATSGVRTGERATVTPPPPLPPASPMVTPTNQPDVSRETPPDGGTPLADELMNETRRRIALEEAVLPLPTTTRVFTISNQKGGVGKTTTTVNLAAALARAGARVLVIDMDPQGNASTALGVDHRSEQQSVYEVLVQDLPLGPMIRSSAEHERLDCVPATIHLAGAEIELVSLVAREQRLRRALDSHLAQMDEPYHYVFIDCPPSLGLLTINAFVAAREVLIPIQCEYYALEGLSQLLSNIELIEKHLNPSLRLSTILLTMYDSRTNLAQQVAQEVREHFPKQTLGTIIPRSVRVSEAPSYGQSVISYDYASSGSLSYREAAAEIARRGAPAVEENK